MSRFWFSILRSKADACYTFPRKAWILLSKISFLPTSKSYALTPLMLYNHKCHEAMRKQRHGSRTLTSHLLLIFFYPYKEQNTKRREDQIPSLFIFLSLFWSLIYARQERKKEKLIASVAGNIYNKLISQRLFLSMRARICSMNRPGDPAVFCLIGWMGFFHICSSRQCDFRTAFFVA